MSKFHNPKYVHPVIYNTIVQIIKLSFDSLDITKALKRNWNPG